MEKLHILQKKEYAFTSDSNMEAEEQAARFEKDFKIKCLKRKMNETAMLMNTPKSVTNIHGI